MPSPISLKKQVLRQVESDLKPPHFVNVGQLKGISEEETLQYIRSLAGIQFDLRVVEVFLRIVKEKPV
jgi:hypothetical protein